MKKNIIISVIISTFITLTTFFIPRSIQCDATFGCDYLRGLPISYYYQISDVGSNGYSLFRAIPSFIGDIMIWSIITYGIIYLIHRTKNR